MRDRDKDIDTEREGEERRKKERENQGDTCRIVSSGRVDALHRHTMPVSLVIAHGGRQMCITGPPLYFNGPPVRIFFSLTIMTLAQVCSMGIRIADKASMSQSQ